ncbi:hypothetical protein [Bifidobacterium catulorum]|uniref:hypothetical protein n=1 Tax=Bifidobacterium catulorum TaxID=1630173 RepID=UPI001F4E1338|nr:hypothetical protein [Bifidobacterium catulorum]
MESRSRRHSRITLGNALGYAMGDIYGGGGPTLAGTYLAVFWTHFCGFDISTAQGIIGGAVVVSAVCAILFGLLSERFYLYRLGRRFTLDQRGDLMLLDEIDRLRAGGSKADVEPEVKTVVERLTGIPYERCWRE